MNEEEHNPNVEFVKYNVFAQNLNLTKEGQILRYSSDLGRQIILPHFLIILLYSLLVHVKKQNDAIISFQPKITLNNWY